MFIPSVQLVSGWMRNLNLPDINVVQNPKPGTLCVDLASSTLKRWTGSSWISVSSIEVPLYAFTTHLFTSGGLAGNTRPQLSTLRTLYAGAPFVDDTALFNAVSGIQKWKVPKTGIYNIVARGANVAGVSGTTARVEVLLGKGDVLDMIVGQLPDNISGYYLGGCGGTWVKSAALGLLAVGAGSHGFNSGQTNPNHSSADLNASGDGTGGGSIITTTLRSSGGSGYLTDAASIGDAGTAVAKAFVNGCDPGYGYNANGHNGTNEMKLWGGFGGGGGGSLEFSQIRYGGGGGYSGGGAKANSNAPVGNRVATSFAASGANVRFRGASLTPSASNVSGSVNISFIE